MELLRRYGVASNLPITFLKAIRMYRHIHVSITYDHAKMIVLPVSSSLQCTDSVVYVEGGGNGPWSPLVKCVDFFSYFPLRLSMVALVIRDGLNI